MEGARLDVMAKATEISSMVMKVREQAVNLAIAVEPRPFRGALSGHASQDAGPWTAYSKIENPCLWWICLGGRAELARKEEIKMTFECLRKVGYEPRRCLV